MLVAPSIVKEPGNEYNKGSNESFEINWYKDALKRADDQIKLQKEMIETLKTIIEKQKKAAKKAGIEL
jgi:hypothetical protein